MRRPVMITDHRICELLTVEQLGHTLRRHILFVFNGGGNAKAVFILGKCIYSRGFEI